LQARNLSAGCADGGGPTRCVTLRLHAPFDDVLH
jgi:hypothetical protein